MNASRYTLDTNFTPLKMVSLFRNHFDLEQKNEAAKVLFI